MGSEQAERALAAGRAAVARQLEREAEDMQIASGEGKVFSLAEKAVLDLSSNQQKNVGIVQAAIDAAVGPLQDRIQALERELSARAEAPAAVASEVAGTGESPQDVIALQEQALREASAHIESLQAEVDRLREKAGEVPVPTPEPTAETPGDQPVPPPTETPDESDAPAAGEEQGTGESSPAGE